MKRINKSEVYSWRVARALKAQLEEAARAEKISLSALLERLAQDWLDRRGISGNEAEQKRMRAALMACAGTMKGDGTSATNKRVREVMGEYLEAKYGRSRPR